MNLFDPAFADRTGNMKASAIREILKITSQPGVISFAGGLPAPDLFPIEKIREASNHLLSTLGPLALQYSTTEGHLPLREWVANRLPNTSSDNVQIMSGSQQGLDLLGKIFLNKGDKVLVEAPTYLGAITSFNPYEPEYISVGMDQDGVDIEQLEGALETNQIKFIYLLPTFQNPSGRLMSLERRKAVVALAQKFKVPILEDDAYHYLGFDGQTLPTLYELDKETGGDNVIYMSTQSKILAPGLRVAWVVAPLNVIQKLVFAKQGADLHTPTFNQLVVYELLKDQAFLTEQISKIQTTYRTRCNLMLGAIEKYLPEDFIFQKPEGGMFFWMEGPQELNALDLLEAAVEEKTAFVPGQPFYADGGGLNTLRFSFSSATEEQLEVGMKGLGLAINKQLKRG